MPYYFIRRGRGRNPWLPSSKLRDYVTGVPLLLCVLVPTVVMVATFEVGHRVVTGKWRDYRV